MKNTDILTDDQLAHIMPTLPARKRSLYLPYLVAAMKEFGINSRAERAAFLAQMGHESTELTRWFENLNYSASRLLEVFRRYFSPASAAEYAHQPQRIANRVYANRMGNGPEASGDGWKFRGTGPFGLTGKENFDSYGKALGINLVASPARAGDPDVGFRIAALYWRRNCQSTARSLTGACDTADLNRISLITRQINGGYNGLPDRTLRYKRALRAIPIEAQIATSPDSPALATSSVVATQETPNTPSPSNVAPLLTDAGQASPSSPADSSWIDEEVDSLTPSDVRDGAQKAGRGMQAWKSLRPLALLYAALEAGNIYAWLGVAVLIGGLGLLVYLHRHDIARIAVKLFRKAAKSDG